MEFCSHRKFIFSHGKCVYGIVFVFVDEKLKNVFVNAEFLI